MLDFDKLDSFILGKMSKSRLPGLSLAVIEDDLVYKRSFGFRDVEYGLGATPQTLYGIGSVTKSFTALALMQLAEESKLRLDEPISKYIPIKLESGEEPIMVWHLLSHTSGIPALAYAEAFIRHLTGSGDKWIPMGNYEDMFNFLKDAKSWIVAKPGDRWFYLNEGYVILGYIIEKISGMNYAEYVKKKILKPLKMSRSYFRKEEVAADSDVATAYLITRDGECKRSNFPYGLSSDGGIIGNVMDLAHYLTMYLNRGTYDGFALLSSKSIEEMEKPRVELPLQIFRKESYGYGLSIVPDFFGSRLVGHSGSILVSTAYIGYIPERRIGIALLANGRGYPLSQMGLYGLALMMGEDPELMPFMKMERMFDQLTGLYETYMGTMKAKIVNDKSGVLQLEIGDKCTDLAKASLVPEDTTGEKKMFYAIQDGGKLQVEFHVKGDDVDLVYERYRLKKVGNLQ